ncbi:hypothetical protein TWF569_002101 [Orbilia oligospora]|nr:hypothetical protein TWF706_011142 [Orbilia oligospora]KAF3122699.1 hypothetical protein TWF569_002101 [Orbilia oligospora]KAF3130496.1 hypothetical protein TWF594_010369 [Orbilia oligospora]
MFSLLRLFLTILYLSVFTAALPSTHQSPLSSPSANPPTGNTICKEDNLPCGTTCYDPTEADCDPQFLTLTRFGDHISHLKKEALEKNKLATEKKQRRVARQKASSISTRKRGSIPQPPAPAPPPPVFPKQINQPPRNVRYVHADIPPPS